MVDHDNVYLSHQLTITPQPDGELVGECSCSLWSYRARGIHGPRRIERQHDRHLEENK